MTTAPDIDAPRRPSICVYCASSRQCDGEYHGAARRLGATLAENGYGVVYGGGGGGSMGALADGALAGGGRVIGVLPRFMVELEWGHRGLSELVLVDDMRQRKQLMLERSQGVVALPGGCGTLDELFDIMTLKRLGLSRAVEERFMDERHRAMWQLVSEPEQVPAAIAAAPGWTSDARRFAVP